MDFAQPDLLWLAALAPLVGGLAWWGFRRRLAATAAWASRGLWDRLLPGYLRGLPLVSSVLLALAVLGVVLALAQPRWGLSRIEVERRGVDVVFVLDTSLSMATRDVEPDRLWVAQTLIRRLVRELPDHRVALVQAEGDGVVMVPLTSDGAVIGLLLDAVQPGSLPMPGTVLVRALERALALFPVAGSRHQVMVVLSDGEDHGPDLVGLVAKLKTRGIVVHAIGVGTLEGKPLELPTYGSARDGSHRNSETVEYKRDEQGNVVVSRLVEETLETVAGETGGVYLRATSPAVEIDAVRRRIDAMETRAFDSELLSTLEERFQWPLALAVTALALQLLVALFRRRAEGPP